MDRPEVMDGIQRLCKDWCLECTYYATMVDRLRQIVPTTSRNKTTCYKQTVDAVCVYLVFRLSKAPPTIVDVAEAYPGVTTRQILRMVQSIKESQEYRNFRDTFQLPPTVSRSRLYLLASRLGLEHDELLVLDRIRETIIQSGRLASLRPSTIDGVSLCRLNTTQLQDKLGENVIADSVRRTRQTIQTAYRTMYQQS